jgi:hypothetical protein
MSHWGPGILESDAALDEMHHLSEQLGFDVNGGTPSQVGARRATLESQLPVLLAATLRPSPLEDVTVAEKLVRCLLANEAKLSLTGCALLKQAADQLAQGCATDAVLAQVPDFDRATSCQVLALVLMRYGCAVPTAAHRMLLDGMLNCDVHVMALDTFHDFFTEDPGVPASMRIRQRELGRGRVKAVHALHQQFSAYLLTGGAAQDLAA